MNRRIFLGLPLCLLSKGDAMAAEPIRLGMAGLVHGHASGFLRRYLTHDGIRMVGIAEPDQAVASRYAAQFRLEPAWMYSRLEEMLDRAKPQGVVVFTNTFDHLQVVEACARRGLPVMMEKPLAVGNSHARAMERAARRSGIPVLVNYETTWYASNRAAWRIARQEKSIGEIRKVVVHDGHRGPKEIGTQAEFFSWLSDPQRNGAGALFDFGCYGANLMTWLMDGRRPIAVTAITQRFKPQIYPKVDDEATILLEYPNSQGIVQASWNWPFDRKDMEVYGSTGYVHTVRQGQVRVRLAGGQEELKTADPIPSPEDDFLRYFAAVVRKEIQPSGLSSLENNLIVIEILDAARRSAATGKRIRL